MPKIILTNHAEYRIKHRRLNVDTLEKVIQKPDDKKLESDGDTQFIRTINQRQVHVVARYLEPDKAWLVISAWVRGEDDPMWRKVFDMFEKPFRRLQRALKPKPQRRR